MNKAIRYLLIIALLLTLTTHAHAQLDPGVHDILQGGSVVGQIYVPARTPGAPRYVEHWVLFSSYVYPSGGSGAVPTLIVASRARYSSESDFFAHVPWSSGSRYVRVEAQESSALPSP